MVTISQLVWFVCCLINRVTGNRRNDFLTDFILEFTIGHRRKRRIEIGNRLHLGIGIINPFHFRDEPCVPQSSGIAYHRLFSVFERLDNITGVQHIQYRRIGIHQLMLYQILITTQLGGMISSHRFMIIRSTRLVETCRQSWSRSSIQHSVIHIFVLQDITIGLGHGERIGFPGGSHEVTAIEITFIDRIHIADKNYDQRNHCHSRT